MLQVGPTIPIGSTSYFIKWLNQCQIEFLGSLKSARLTGSFSDGSYREDSDVDIKLNEKDLKLYKQFLYGKNMAFDSELPGHITCEGVEVFTCFTKRQRCASEVFINGVRFKTW